MRSNILTAIVMGGAILVGSSQIEDETFVREPVQKTFKAELKEDKAKKYNELCPDYDYEVIGLKELLRGYVAGEEGSIKGTRTANRILNNLNVEDYNLTIEKKDGSWTLPIKVSEDDELIFFYKKTGEKAPGEEAAESLMDYPRIYQINPHNTYRNNGNGSD